jgi:hypothetical protein
MFVILSCPALFSSAVLSCPALFSSFANLQIPSYLASILPKHDLVEILYVCWKK